MNQSSMMTPDELWEGYEHHAMSPTAPRLQRTEMRKAFIAGMYAMLGLLQGMDTDDEEAAAEGLEAYWQDLSRRMVTMSPPRI